MYIYVYIYIYICIDVLYNYIRTAGVLPEEAAGDVHVDELGKMFIAIYIYIYIHIQPVALYITYTYN